MLFFIFQLLFAKQAVLISKDSFAWCLFLPQSDGPYAKEDKLAEIPSESGNNHGDAVMCCWGRVLSCGRTLRVYYLFFKRGE